MVWVIAIAWALFLALLAVRTPDTNPDQMIAKYQLPESQFIRRSDGLNIHFTDQGCRECPTLVFVHGGNASLHSMLPTAKFLEDKYRIISFDNAGHGLTGPHPANDYSADGFIDVLSAVLLENEIDRFTLLGSSMGGWVSWRYALLHPERLNALILVGAYGAPAPKGVAQRKLYLAARIRKNPLGRWISQHITPRSIVKRSLEGVYADERLISDTLTDRYWELARFPGNRRAAAIRSQTDREDHIADRLIEIETPTLLIWGREDEVIPVHFADSFQALIPNTEKVLFDGVAHVPTEEAPLMTADAIDQFLRKTLDGPTQNNAEVSKNVDGL
ncbi:MAG: alpha/beta hydrolase [Pseudomonadota bacterium]